MGGIFWDDFFGMIFLGGFFGRIIRRNSLFTLELTVKIMVFVKILSQWRGGGGRTKKRAKK